MTFIPGQRPVAPWRFHHWWGQWSTAASLPNVAGSPAQYNAEIQAGDLAWVVADGKLYVCTDPTPGSAVWVPISTGGSGGSASWEWKFSGSMEGQNSGQNATTWSDGAPSDSLPAGQGLIQYPITHDEVVTIDSLVVNILSNALTTESDVTVIKNGAPTGVTVSIGATATGVFQETLPDSITATKPDLIGLLVTNTSGGATHFLAGTASFRMSLP